MNRGGCFRNALAISLLLHVLTFGTLLLPCSSGKKQPSAVCFVELSDISGVGRQPGRAGGARTATVAGPPVQKASSRPAAAKHVPAGMPGQQTSGQAAAGSATHRQEGEDAVLAPGGAPGRGCQDMPGGFGDALATGNGDGSGARVVDAAPALAHYVEPRYPAIARRRHISGEVLVSVYVTASGQAHSPSIERASPEGLFEKCVIQAVSQWSFRPARRNGLVIGARITVPVRFNLENP